jgi:hypothetical protein
MFVLLYFFSTVSNELLKVVAENFKKLTTELAIIPIELSEKKALDGHSKNTLMSINNLVAYFVGWEQLVLKWNDKKSNGLLQNT